MPDVNRFERAVHQAQQATSTGAAAITKEEAARILAGAADPTSRGEAEQALRAAGFTDIADARASIEQVNRQDAETLARHGYTIGEGGHANLQEAIRAQQRATHGGNDAGVTGIMDENTRALLRTTEGEQLGMLRELGFADIAAFQRDYNDGKAADQQLPTDGSVGPATRTAIREEHRRSFEPKTIRYGQANLGGLGYDIGATGVDGFHGPRTRAAIEAFQRDAGLEPVSGVFDEDTRAALGAKIGDVQQALVDAGFELGPHGVDGRYGPDTRAAIETFQRQWNAAHPDPQLPVDGQLRAETLTAIGKPSTERPVDDPTGNTDPAATTGNTDPAATTGNTDPAATTGNATPDPTSTDPSERREADRAAIFDPRTPLERTSVRLGDHEPGLFGKIWDWIKEIFTLGKIETRTRNDKLTDDEISELEQRGTRLAATDGFIAFYQIPGDQPGNIDRRQLEQDIESALKRANPKLEAEQVERRAAVMLRATLAAAEARVTQLRPDLTT